MGAKPKPIVVRVQWPQKPRKPRALVSRGFAAALYSDGRPDVRVGTNISTAEARRLAAWLLRWADWYEGKEGG